jgi:hypothetical protein
MTRPLAAAVMPIGAIASSNDRSSCTMLSRLLADTAKPSARTPSSSSFAVAPPESIPVIPIPRHLPSHPLRTAGRGGDRQVK